MGRVLHADGSDLDVGEYNGRQASLMARHAEQLLNTGPESGFIDGQSWKNLQTVTSNRGFNDDTASKDAFISLGESDMILYLFSHWMKKYAPIFGTLARIEEQPIEVVQSEIQSFQHHINDNIGELRFLWGEKTGQNLPLQTAIEQVRWNGPRVEELTDGEQGDTEHFLSIDALLPYVNQPRHDMCDLLLDSDHVSASMLRIPVHGDKADAVKKELAKYR